MKVGIGETTPFCTFSQRMGYSKHTYELFSLSSTSASLSGLSSSPLKGVQGSPCRGLGRPQFPSLLRAPPAAARKREEKRFLRGHPAPRQRAAALCTPARWENWKALASL
ncbi:hypothetical protein [Reticulibacter mediterranei]|uniref:hypothetical protein n=1 Tax=Reticulibacter mediterranei TaxID=2778369 RepID=UPI001C690425|nr:hypothetical protein [Reticulibacter mediterranei]